MKKLLILLAIVYGSSTANAQNMNTTGTANTNACSGTFYDSGGNGGNYSNNESGVRVFCPSVAGNVVRLNFTAFNVENNIDFMEIYNGNSITDPLFGVFTGATLPGIIQATFNNPTGCITVRFLSNGSAVASGWQATVSCVAPCQNVTANLVSTTPAATANIIKICQGGNVSFTGSGTFSVSPAGATYQWVFGDGTTGTGTTVNHVYSTTGSYLVNLKITDPNNCTSQNALNLIVQVSTTPTIVTSATPSPLCTNQFSLLNANVTMNTFTDNCSPPISGTTYLPDGSGTSYSTSIPVTCYPTGSTIGSAADFINVCLTMEHSWLGDLSLRLRCPSGQFITLKANPGGGGTYLGNPIDDVVSGPGTGLTYCFSPTAPTTNTLVSAPTQAATMTAGNTKVPGDYAPVNPFSNFIGCPLNGSWTIEITDHISQDDGYIFNWDLNFAQALTGMPAFTPVIVSQGWVPATYLYPINATQANVVATSMGTFPFTYSVTDDFGCTYTAPQSVVVNCTSLPAGLVSFDAKALSDKRVELRWITESEQNTNRFEIDRSLDGENWHFVTAAQAAGDSEEEIVYSSTDMEPYRGISYYRLRTIDNDGTQKVSDMDVVTINPDEGTLIVYPNPATDMLTVEGNDEDLESMYILNAVGQDVTTMVIKKSGIPSKLQLDISPLVKGTYLIRTVTTSYLIVKQ